MARGLRSETVASDTKLNQVTQGGVLNTLISQADGSNKRAESTNSLEVHTLWMKQHAWTTILIVVSMFLVAVILGWVVVPWFVHQQVANKIVISPKASPDIYAAWVHPPCLVYLNVYIFNVTNSELVRTGALPTFKELGPYVFRENRTKIQIQNHDATDTISYKELVSYHFAADLSGGAGLKDVVTIINVPFVAAAIKMGELPWPIDGIALALLLGFKQNLFMQRTVEDVLFKGIKVDFLEAIETEINLSLLPNNTFGYLVGLNGTAQGPFTISRGTYDKESYGTILKYKNDTQLGIWGDRSTPCNQIRGTDGTIFQPFLTKSTVLSLFNAELCRSLKLIYNKDITFEGIHAYRFAGSPEHLLSPAINHENQCYCAEWDDNPDNCLKQGTFDLGPCRDGAPVAASAPHFFNGDPVYKELSGLTPDEAHHDTFIIMEPLTGVALQISKKIQINLMLKKVMGVSALAKVPEMLFPLFWAEEAAYLDMGSVEKLKAALFQIWLTDFLSKWIVLGIAFVASFFCVMRKKARKDGYGLELKRDFLSETSQHIRLKPSCS